MDNTKQIDLPHFARPKVHGRFFTSFYMDDADIAKLQAMFSHCGGGTDRWQPFYVDFNGKPSMNDALDVGEARTVFLAALTVLEKDSEILVKRWAFADLLHKGYYVIIGFDGKTLACVKGKIKANQDTHCVLLDKMPASVKKVVKDYFDAWVNPSIELIKKFSPV